MNIHLNKPLDKALYETPIITFFPLGLGIKTLLNLFEKGITILRRIVMNPMHIGYEPHTSFRYNVSFPSDMIQSVQSKSKQGAGPCWMLLIFTE